MNTYKEKYRSWIPHGFDFLSPSESRELIAVQGEVRSIFQRNGFLEIIPPTFDYSNTFKITHRENQKNIFESKDRAGDLLAVRSDLTVQVIKAVASGRLGKNYPKKLSYIQRVFHDTPWGSGLSREILQAGVELIGESENSRVGELLTLSRDTLIGLGVEPAILYGDIRFLEILFSSVPVEIREPLSEAFHNKDTARIAELIQGVDLNEDTVRLLLEVPITFGGTEVLDKLDTLCRHNDKLLKVLASARKHKNLIYDFSLVRELSYYTGPVFEAYAKGSKEKILSGGVYDSLFATFGAEEKMACGFAIHLSPLVRIRMEKSVSHQN